MLKCSGDLDISVFPEMASTIRRHVFQRVMSLLENSAEKRLEAGVPVPILKFKFGPNSMPQLHLSLTDIIQTVDTSVEDTTKKLERLQPDHIISQVTFDEKSKNEIVVRLNQEKFLKEILEGKTARHPATSNQKRLVFDFSSPNIAKPFHVGHLRSTVIGSYLCNLHEWLGYEVIRLNYIGDWGTQFGMIKVGLNILNLSEQDFIQRPLSALLDAYVAANKAAEENPDIGDRARKYFADMEHGRDNDISSWEKYRRYTLEELENTYARLGIKFSEYAWESNYPAHSLKDVLSKMENRGLLSRDEGGRTVGHLCSGNTVPLLKSDGSGLYLTRDVAAAIDRYEKHNFSGMYYVVDDSQQEHFKNLFELLNCLDLPWAQRLKHISFGRVRGMSTRRGKVVFLSDVLNEARDLMDKTRQTSPNTRFDESGQLDVADILGTSAVIIADLSHSRKADYTFSWNSAIQSKGNTGVRLQYTHCRLCSLRERSGVLPATHCEPSLLPEQTALRLALQIARFDEIIHESMERLEANVLVIYLFQLCDAINQAMLELKVKGEGEVGAQRLFLFEESRTVLRRGMELLGLHPLTQM